MKKLIVAVVVTGLIGLASACRPTNRHVVISDGSDNWTLKIEYFGCAKFNHDTTAIAAISKNGLVKFKGYGRTLVAENGSGGQIIYRIDGGKSQSSLTNADKEFVAHTVKTMAKRGYNDDGKWENN